MRVSQEVRQAARSLKPQYREQFAHGISPCPLITPASNPDSKVKSRMPMTSASTPHVMMKSVRRQRHTGCIKAWATDDDKNDDDESDGDDDDDHVEDDF